MTRTVPDLILRIRKALSDEFDRRITIQDEDDVDLDTLSLRDALKEFACPVAFLVVRLDAPRDIHGLRCECLSYLRFDITAMGKAEVEDLGELDFQTLSSRDDLARLFFGAKATAAVFDLGGKSYSVGASEEGSWFSHVIPHDVRVDSSGLVNYLLFEDIMMNNRRTIARNHDRKPQFDELYGMKPPPLRSAKDLLEGHFALPKYSLEGTTPSSLAQLVKQARHVDAIQLIPKVPEPVATTFGIAKDLYVYSTFQYLFGTVSAHYAYLALEAALKHRWCAMLSMPVEVRGAKRGKVFVEKATHESVCRAADKCEGRRTVNGVPFGSGMPWLIDQLVKRQVLRKYEGRKMKSAMFLRNGYSHREFGIIYPADVERLRLIAWHINLLFHTPG